jgi:tetratricopeptide (TPR) repeat protein
VRPAELSPLFLALLLAAEAAAAEGDAASCARLNDTGRFAEALPRCAAAVEEARAGAADRAALAAALNGHGLALEMTGDRAAAERAYDESLSIDRALGARDQEALVLSNLAALAIGGGDYGRALDRLAEEEAVARAAGDAPWTAEELRIVRINRGVALEQLGAYREALAELRQIEAAAPPGPGSENDAALAVNLAVLYRNLGDPRRALRLLDGAAAAYEREGDRAALANVYLNRALAHALNLADPVAARSDLARALALARLAGDRAEELRTLQAAGELELEAGGLEAARRDLEAALALARSSGARAGEWTALAALGRLELAAGRADPALERLRAAEKILEEASVAVGNSALGGSLRRDQRRLYASAVDLLAERALAADEAAAFEALAWSERLKDRELLDAISKQGAAGSSPAPADAATLARAGGSATTLAYFFGERRVWRWRLDGRGVALADAGDPREIAERTRRVWNRLERGGAPDAADLAALGRFLLPADLEPERELVLAPDAILFYLPFALLPDPADPGRRLMERHSLRSAPSLSVLARIRRESAPARWRFAALAAPETSAGATIAGAESLLAARYGLPPLPGSAREAASAAAALGEPATVALGSAATESNFGARAGEGATVLHLAAHTLVDESLQEGVAIFLAPDGESGAGHDGRLTPAEIARTRLASDLVVLSGCRTALAGDAGAGESRSLASLGGAFLAAGARGVVASLWEVGDAATAALMEQFYFELARGAPPAEALRRAQRRLASDGRWDAPRNWAGFVVLGNPPPLPSSPPARVRWLPVAASLALVAAGALLWRGRSGHRSPREIA